MAQGRMGRVPFTSSRTMEEIIELGKRMGCPEISWGMDDHGAYVIYHWEHGDRKIYPTEDTVNKHYDPRPGDIGITTISGAGGKAIKVATWLNGDGWNSAQHAFVVVEPYRSGMIRIVEAMPGGAQHVANWHRDQDTVYLRCPDQYRDAVAQAAHSFVGVPYGWADYAALALHRFRIPTPRLKRFIEQSGSMICSQLCDRAAELGGWHLFADGRWHGDVTPGDLLRLYHAQTVSPGLA